MCQDLYLKPIPLGSASMTMDVGEYLCGYFLLSCPSFPLMIPVLKDIQIVETNVQAKGKTYLVAPYLT